MDEQRGRPVVIKAYYKAKMCDKHYHKLAREIAVMRAMRGCSHVVELMGTFQDASAVYLIQEWCGEWCWLSLVGATGRRAP